MSEFIDRSTFDHLVQLAALELTDEQAEYLLRELNNQLKAIRELEAIPLDEGVPATWHGVPYTPQISPALRDDNWQPFERPRDILSQAPQVEGDYLIVPDIPHTTLE